ncbi:hypothetical protein IWQ60_007521 [Tieghemiomyces parasiticus]|uniref:Secreted protein n=1 Tax=Tieghemiomyces parasiticus TaxID=78921 RepID=A0A9W7ZXR6_9FUNG|nr:hypothetical protein IWQ60_007521 [Tieghemiomyces parasiticus]
MQFKVILTTLALATFSMAVHAQGGYDFVGYGPIDEALERREFFEYGPHEEALERRELYGYGYEPEYQYVMRRSFGGGVGAGAGYGGPGFGALPSIFSSSKKVDAHKLNKQALKFKSLKDKNLAAKQKLAVQA